MNRKEGSRDSSVSSASTTELEARRLANSRLLELEDNLEDLEETDSGLPSPKSVSVTMDEYVSASIVGRSSYASGDLLTAVTQFSEALGIELQTELECLYDTNLGFVSGLVRREVESRLHDTPVSSNGKNCGKILNQLGDVYIGASTQSDVQPSKSKWYLRMGAALCVVNEWEKAKQVYKEGITMCKDKKDLKIALKNLIKLEQITSSADLPDEDRDQMRTPNPRASPAKSVQSSPARMSTPSPKLERRRSRIKLRKRSKSISAGTNSKHMERKDSIDGTKPSTDVAEELTGRTQRSESMDSGVLSPTRTIPHTQVTRVASLDVPKSPKLENERKLSDCTPSPLLAASDGLIQIRTKKDKKFALNILNGSKRKSISGLFHSFGRNNALSTLSSESKQSWNECFTPDGCSVASYQSMTTSAVAHMRKLATEPVNKHGNRESLSDDQKDGEQETTPQRRMTFNAVNFTSMKIDSDDSELDDD